MRNLRRRLVKDHGIGMTEVAVAIVVLGIVLVGLFPMMVDSIRLAQSNAEVGQANRIVSSQIDAARTSIGAGVCTAGTSSLAAALTAAEQQRFRAERVVTCSGKLATVTINVQRVTDPSKTVSSATTQVVTL